MKEFQTVVFSLNNQLCGADTSQVKEIKGYEAMTRVPRMPKFMDGLLNLRGRVVPVVNLNRRFELGETEITKKTKVIITEVEGKQVGFIVNDVFEIAKFTESEMETPPECIFSDGRRFIKYIGKKGERLISILDLAAILTDAEIKKAVKAAGNA